jgi:hypothetical protein
MRWRRPEHRHVRNQIEAFADLNARLTARIKGKFLTQSLEENQEQHMGPSVQVVGHAALHKFAVPVLSVEVREAGVQILVKGDTGPGTHIVKDSSIGAAARGPYSGDPLQLSS